MKDPQNGLKLKKDKIYHFHSYKNTFTGKQLTTWLVQKTGKKYRVSAVKLGQEMVKMGKIKHVADKQDFADEKYLYVFVE